jgi:hypothetical protein
MRELIAVYDCEIGTMECDNQFAPRSDPDDPGSATFCGVGRVFAAVFMAGFAEFSGVT